MDFTVTDDGFVLAQRPGRLHGYWPEVFVAFVWVSSFEREISSSLLVAAVSTVGLVLWRRTRLEVDAAGISWRNLDTIRTSHLSWSSIDDIVINWATNELRGETSGDTVPIAMKLPSQPAYRRHMQAILGCHVAVVRDVPTSWTPASPPTALAPDEQTVANRPSHERERR